MFKCLPCAKLTLIVEVAQLRKWHHDATDRAGECVGGLHAWKDWLGLLHKRTTRGVLLC